MQEAIAPGPPDATLMQIGRLTYRLGLFENILGIVVRGWIPAAERPELDALSKWPASKKISVAWDRAGSLKVPEARASLEAALKSAEEAYEVRNHVLHGQWLTDPVKQQSVSVNPARGPVERLGTDVDDAAAAADKALRALITAMFKEKGLGDPPFPFPFLNQSPPA